MVFPKAFISFEMEDRWARDFLVQEAKDKNIAFFDYSVKNPFDSNWKTECKKRIAMTKGTIVLIGETTWKSEAVLWEIAETIQQGHFSFGIQINKGRNYIIPNGLSNRNVMHWDFEQIANLLKTWN
ncbi:TIR domain-containing protein [Sphaerochaeta sp. S2]|uniref:TIR domain-containing protein n=1 Tax=Sphaerochaeta sp. S2 TaxID=2798868 RepID=UPI0018EA24C1|nr:TIR domain-containing protein [Sphaerochaeta sp. S2]MBJ2357140.1 TIR domain-containing protein [Sphaerochaeta sp. S2]